MQINYAEWIGYLASIVVAVSLVMNSILKFRWINLAGSVIFAIYGFLISAWPVSFFNSIIVIINIIYLYKFYNKKDDFDIMEVDINDKFLNKFMQFHKNDIYKFNPELEYSSKDLGLNFVIFRNMKAIGIFLSQKESIDTLNIELDYVIEEFRDYKNGIFLYGNIQDRLKKEGFETLKFSKVNNQNETYIQKMGFQLSSEGFYTKSI
ncbi:hypothetical protein EGI22_06305 [Lacihabitans sp. LS3-19]|uniref:YgjV family protein n=1 Tax=Lacihabitans sp. LS3-19 TaxID=2487335 RepID=UPI0020CE877E|nr:YgjV family protein [Lacihabitans sp. LS3-19]MCP9767516.1 hypothetical protein [Lacihabitans sp. LS3-19]